MAKTTKFEIKHRFNGDVLFAAKTTDQREAILSAIDSSANLSSADLSFADLRSANLSSANLRSADLRSANLRSADLRSADLRSADLRSADLRSANLRYANLRSADLRSADLSSANLSGVRGLLEAGRWIIENLESTADGVIAYKVFGEYHHSPENWKIEPGAEITETVNPIPTIDCGCGVNVATLGRVQQSFPNAKEIWRVLVPWVELAGSVVPYHTDGKFRVPRVKLLEVVNG